MVMTVAAAEAAVGLALLIALYRLKETVDITELKVLKW
jgi:NADH-quinone oxidoreductase subunit K